VKTREHVDLWLHGFAMISDDTARVPFFRRGYRDEMIVAKNRRNVTTQLDANRDRLRARFAVSPSIAVNAQFAAMPFGSWEEMRRAIDLFLQTEGNASRANTREVANVITLFAGYFPTPGDREWLRTFASSLQDERDRFYHSYWIQTQGERAPALAAVDSLWQRVERPKFQRFLNSSQQASGDFLLSLPLDGEGRTLNAGPRENVAAVQFPARATDAAEAVYVFVHETVGSVTSTVVDDNTTPAEKRDGLAARLQSAAQVRGGLLLISRVAPELADGYARFYLRAANVKPMGTDAPAALAAAFPLPQPILTGILQQLEILLGGI
jgi:hypothetical protein